MVGVIPLPVAAVARASSSDGSITVTFFRVSIPYDYTSIFAGIASG